MISLFAPITAPPNLIETYFSEPELSATSVPPYKPLVSVVGIPSIASSFSEEFIVDLPSNISPPHNPLKFVARLPPLQVSVPVLSLAISSTSDVKIIGSVAVPLAIILPPLATISAAAFSPVPAAPFTIVPASIVKVCPLFTKTLPFRI